jgi:transcriptional regulator
MCSPWQGNGKSLRAKRLSPPQALRYNPSMGKRQERHEAGSPPVPEERVDTIRRHLVALLEEYRLAGRDLSKILGLPERELYDHLEHVRRTLHKEGGTLVVEPAVCERCGFQFRKRERLSKPGKCPLCRGSLIASPLFSILRPVD